MAGDLKESSTWHLHLTGIVQGVGFRPMVANFAKQFNLKGFVCNAADGLHVEFNATEADTKNIVDNLLGQAPPLAKIQSSELNKVNEVVYNDFKIIESDSSANPNLPLTPDFALCEDCRRELHHFSNRRHHYPFITCTKCGPRYSITNAVPYDRVNTTMHSFYLCDDCAGEYESLGNRRYFSQTNSCDSCGVKLVLYKLGKNRTTDTNSIINEAVKELKKGNIIAVKGIGGYLLLCDASNSEAIKTLRKRKHRPSKPFAVMFKNIEQANESVSLNNVEKDMLLSPVSPVILAKFKSKKCIAANDIAPGLSSLGVMIPYAPLFELLLSEFGKPLIATSGNISNSPVVYNDEQALEELSRIADAVLVHNREIVTPQDDSVIRFSPLHHRQIIIRRSRGIAPSYFRYEYDCEQTTLATGALMKSSFTIAYSNNIYVSQYLGSTDGYDAQVAYRETLTHLLNVLHTSPQKIITDKHPQYFSNELAKELAIKYYCDVIEVQHHKAHFAAVLAENNLMQCEEKVLGVIWDGTGLGDDENIWGGEFFVFEKNSMNRCNHFEYFPVLLGDKMAKEPRLSALAICNKLNNAKGILEDKFSSTERSLYHSMLMNDDFVQCSSVGRIFDAVASLLNICDKQSYEGEAALLLETIAQQYVDKNGYDFNENYFSLLTDEDRVSTSTLLQGIVDDINSNKPVDFIAAKFHYSLATLIAEVAEKNVCKKIAFSGGVFQNALLVDLIQHHLSNRFKLFFHKELSPNDENVSFGQFVYADNGIENVELMNRINKVQECDANEAK